MRILAAGPSRRAEPKRADTAFLLIVILAIGDRNNVPPYACASRPSARQSSDRAPDRTASPPSSSSGPSSRYRSASACRRRLRPSEPARPESSSRTLTPSSRSPARGASASHRPPRRGRTDTAARLRSSDHGGVLPLRIRGPSSPPSSAPEAHAPTPGLGLPLAVLDLVPLDRHLQRRHLRRAHLRRLRPLPLSRSLGAHVDEGPQIYTGGESWLNKPWRSQVRFAGASKEKQPAGIDNVSLSA